METQNFKKTIIPALDEAGRDEIRKKVGLSGFVGRKPFTDILMPRDYSHATDEYIAHNPQGGDENPPGPPTSGTGRRRAGVIGDIASSSAMSRIGTVIR